MTAPRRSSSTGRRLGRLAAGAAFAAVVVTGGSVTREWSGPAEDDLGLGPFVIALTWAVAGVLVAMLVLPTWLGSTWCRRVLGVASLAGFAGALHWLSYEPGDAQGFAVGIAVAVLLGCATAAAALAERRLRSGAAPGVAVVGVLVLALGTGLWRAHSSSEISAVEAVLSVSADGRTVRSEFSTGRCVEPLRLEVVHTPQEVRVLTRITIDRGFPTSCGGAAVPGRLEATLDAPLGTRVLRPM